MDRQEFINVGQRGSDSLSQWLIPWGTEERIEPDQAPAGALETRHFGCQKGWVATIPSIADHNHGGARTQHPPAPPVVERFDGLPDPGAARPVLHRLGHLGNRIVHVTAAQLPGNPGEAGAEDENLNRLQPMLQGMDESQQETAVAVH